MVEPIQGLRTSLQMADAADAVEVLKNLNLDIKDLEKIRGIAAEGVLPEDIKGLSGLNVDLEKHLVGIFTETRTYGEYLISLNDGRNEISSNMVANSSIIASSFKFNTLAANGSVVSSDISTSRASAWSSLGSGVYYGSKVRVGGSVELSSLTIDRQIKAKQFESEIPTHKIRVKIDGVSYDAFAMKNIPVKFKGYFSSARNVYMTVKNARPSGGSPYLRPSWVIKNLDDDTSLTFQNVLSGSLTSGLTQARNSVISVLGSRARERAIEFYYPLDYIYTIFLPDLKIYEFPQAVFSNVDIINLSGSDFIEMPNFAKYAPKLTSLNISNVNLTRSDTAALKTFSNSVVSRLPTTLKSINLDNTYAGTATANLDILTALTSFTMDNSYAINARRSSGTSPSVNSPIEYYSIADQRFSTLHSSIQNSTTLKYLNFSRNGMGTTPVTIASNVIETIAYNGNQTPFIDVSGKTTLKNYYRIDTSVTGNTNPLFINCTALEDIRISNTRIGGPLPSFNTNKSLKIFNAWGTLITAADSTYAINASTFGEGFEGGCRPTLQSFTLYSPYLSGSFQDKAFDGLVNLTELWISSSLNGISGSLPSLMHSAKLATLYLRYNNLSGTIPSFSSNPNLTTLNLAYNKLTGSFPLMNHAKIARITVNNNLLTSIPQITCPSLIELTAFSNLITSVPNLSNCPAIQTVHLSNNPMSGSTSYSKGYLSTNLNLKYLNLANCGIKRGSIDQILIDLAANYDANPRSGVTIILSGNQSPSASTEIQTFIISRLRAAGWTIQVS